MQLDIIRNGEPVVLRWDPCPYSPIHDRDILEQTKRSSPRHRRNARSSTGVATSRALVHARMQPGT